MYNMGGDQYVMTYGDYYRQQNEDIEFFDNGKHCKKSNARGRAADAVRNHGIESKDFFGPVKYPQADLSLPGQRDEYRELVLYWDKQKKAEAIDAAGLEL